MPVHDVLECTSKGPAPETPVAERRKPMGRTKNTAICTCEIVRSNDYERPQKYLRVTQFKTADEACGYLAGRHYTAGTIVSPSVKAAGHVLTRYRVQESPANTNRPIGERFPGLFIEQGQVFLYRTARDGHPAKVLPCGTVRSGLSGARTSRMNARKAPVQETPGPKRVRPVFSHTLDYPAGYFEEDGEEIGRVRGQVRHKRAPRMSRSWKDQARFAKQWECRLPKHMDRMPNPTEPLVEDAWADFD